MTRETYLMLPHVDTLEWAAAWAGLVNKGYSVDDEDDDGEIWQYVGSELRDLGRVSGWVHVFRHRNHPAEGPIMIPVPASKGWAPSLTIVPQGTTSDPMEKKKPVFTTFELADSSVKIEGPSDFSTDMTIRWKDPLTGVEGKSFMPAETLIDLGRLLMAISINGQRTAEIQAAWSQLQGLKGRPTEPTTGTGVARGEARFQEQFGVNVKKPD